MAHGVNFMIRLFAILSIFACCSTPLYATVPNDPYYNQQWALHATGSNGGDIGADINASGAWDESNRPLPAPEVIVAVIDSGVWRDHPDLSGRILGGWGYVPTSFIYYHKYDGHELTWDLWATGTAVAGIIAAKTDNGVGIAGIGYNAVRIIPLKPFLYTPSSYEYSTQVSFLEDPSTKIAYAIDYAVSHGARVIQAGWALDWYSQAIYDAISRANAAGVLVVVSAGQSDDWTRVGKNLDLSSNQRYPAEFGLPNIITVASTDHKGNLWKPSNYGYHTVDLAAPGENIFTTLPPEEVTLKHTVYGAGAGWGGDIAAAFVSGTAALMWANEPRLTYLQVKEIILETVDHNGLLETVTKAGGKLNSGMAVSYARAYGQYGIAGIPDTGAYSDAELTKKKNAIILTIFRDLLLND